MGRIVDLCGEIAAAVEEGSEGLFLPPDDWERLRQDWNDEDIEDALGFVRESLLQGELVDSADSLSARLVEVLGAYSEAAGLAAPAGTIAVDVEIVGQLVRRVARLEEVLEAFRDGAPPDRRGFDVLRARLADRGIEEEMAEGRAEADEIREAGDEDDEDA